jgi:hypothetical protein
MKTMTTKLFAAALGLSLLCIPAMAKDAVHTKQVHFDKGTTGTTAKGNVKGSDSVRYKLGAKEGQFMRVSIKSRHAHFNVYAPGKGPGDMALFVGEPGVSYAGELPANGTYTISVYLMRNEARRGTNTSYALKMHID